jgi:hypothetical protein
MTKLIHTFNDLNSNKIREKALRSNVTSVNSYSKLSFFEQDMPRDQYHHDVIYQDIICSSFHRKDLL